jgi:hypothetical protein
VTDDRLVQVTLRDLQWVVAIAAQVVHEIPDIPRENYAVLERLHVAINDVLKGEVIHE